MRLPTLAVLLLTLAACQSPQPAPRTAEEIDMFGPVTMRLHPTFTSLKNWTGDPRPDGIEAVLEFDDRFGEPTKSAGKVIFELFEFRKGFADPRGARLLQPWTGSLMTVDEQQRHWHREYGAYSFLLDYPEVRTDRTYVLTATFESAGGKRFTSQTILIGHKTPKGEKSPSESGSTQQSPDLSGGPPPRQHEP